MQTLLRTKKRPLTPRHYGQFHIYSQVPNATERLEMSFRTLGRQFDWDLEKYRMGAKTIDKGTKHRLKKNMVRFFKHPIGYTYWKFHGRLNKVNIFSAVFGMFVLNELFKARNVSQANVDAQKFKLRSGVIERGTGTQRLGPYDQKLMHSNTFIGALHTAPALPTDFGVSRGTRQAYRKHFEARRTYGI